MDFELFMHLALDEARKGADEVPVGALLVDDKGEIVASAHNLREAKNDPTAHAELEVLRAAADLSGDWRFEGTTLFVTLEPCVMCAGAIREARISRVVFAAWNEVSGASGSVYDVLRDPRLGKTIEVIPGVLENEASTLLSRYFKSVRETKLSSQKYESEWSEGKGMDNHPCEIAFDNEKLD